jgi:hypothetical protein
LLACALSGVAPSHSRNNDPAEEAKAIAATSGAVTREGASLRLRLLSGVTKTLTNVAECADPKLRAQGAECNWGYEIRRYDRARHLFVVNIYYYEGTDALLVDDRTGAEAHFDGMIVLSPSGVYVSEIITDAYDKGAPAVQVWRRGRLKFVREWRGAPGFDGDHDSYHPGDINYAIREWNSDREFQLEVLYGERFLVRRGAKDWRVRKLAGAE